ncbi:MAG: hypothetical protein IH591_09065 [Bacteroidales bacterium]|nr:hypothetical protein [Bacteroidales bacterium]
MRRVFIFLLVATIVAMPDIYGQRKKQVIKSDTLAVVNDSLEYELIIMDPGFDTWLVTKPSMNFHTNEYYRQKNIQYVREWNFRYMNPSRHGDLYQTYIDYNPTTEYDIELNYKLYYYFVYFEEKNRVRLIPFSRK